MAWYRCGGGGLPAGLQSDMDTVLNKKFSTSTTYPPTDWPDTVNLMGPLPEKTASGAIANITDGADGVPVKNWLVTLPASLDGYTSIVGSQAGKNLIKIASDNYADGQKSTVEYTNSGVSVTATGAYGRSGYSFAVKTGQTYTLSFTGYSTGDYNRLYLNNKVSWSGQFKNFLLTSEEAQYSVTFTSTTDLLFIGLYVSGGGTTGTMTISNVQLEVNSSASTYEAYEAPTQYTASLGRTIYGGQADIVTGEGEDGYIKYVIDGVNNYAINVSGTNFNIMPYGLFIDGTINKWVCDTLTASSTNFGYNSSQGFIFIRQAGWSSLTGVTDVESFNAYCQNNPITLILPKTTADDFTFTPITPTPETALGVNNFWADEGDSDVTYRADISLALQALGGGGRGLMMMRPTEPEETEETEETEGLEDELNR